MITTIVTTKGQVVIPYRIRRKLDIKKGTKLSVEESNNEIILRPLNAAYFEKMAGVLATKGKLANMIIEARSRDKTGGGKE
jgi:AbrB family looped-hinge helix DNA binding protein